VFDFIALILFVYTKKKANKNSILFRLSICFESQPNKIFFFLSAKFEKLEKEDGEEEKVFDKINF
jgi:hypothetical protein